MQRTCSLPGCDKTHRAKGLCVTHYNQQKLDPGVRHAKVASQCGWCGTATHKDKCGERRYGATFCSLRCRDRWTFAKGIHATQSTAAMAKRIASFNSPINRARRKQRRAAKGTKGSSWTAGVCGRCGDRFVSGRGSSLGRYCSDQCKRRAKQSRRRAHRAGVLSDGYSRHGIFVRDGWRCHLCRKPTARTAKVPHPRAPVIDHLIPLAAGGDDTAANVATACFYCNSRRRDVGAAQLQLFG